MRLYAFAVYAFLYLPIAIIAIFSFNAGRHASQFTGFSVQWYGKALGNPFVTEAFQTSLTVALSSAVLASLFGTMAALALQSVKGKLRVAFDALIYIAVMVPGIVIGIATLIALVTLFGWINPLLAMLGQYFEASQPARFVAEVKLPRPVKWYCSVSVGGRCLTEPMPVPPSSTSCFCGYVRISSAAMFGVKK